MVPKERPPSVLLLEKLEVLARSPSKQSVDVAEFSPRSDWLDDVQLVLEPARCFHMLSDLLVFSEIRACL